MPQTTQTIYHFRMNEWIADNEQEGIEWTIRKLKNKIRGKNRLILWDTTTFYTSFLITQLTFEKYTKEGTQ